MTQTLAQWLTYIEGLHHSSIDLGLSRILPIAQKHGLSHFTCPVVTVGGTNGKGSCVALLEQIYHSAGYRVAAYTSPHLDRFNERIRIDTTMVTDTQLMNAFDWVESARQGQCLSFFEFTTLATLHIFKQINLDVILLEVGLGGRLDAVNIVQSDVAIITSISLDHQNWLGDSLADIAREKAGIARSQKPCIYAEDEAPAELYQKLQEIGAIVVQRGHEFNAIASNRTWTYVDQIIRWKSLPKPTIKLSNAAAAMQAVMLLKHQLPVTKTAVINALQNVNVPGRQEYFAQPVPILFDVAHNPAATQFLVNNLQKRWPQRKWALVFGILNDKDYRMILSLLKPVIGVCFVVNLDTCRALEREYLMLELQAQGIKCCYNSGSMATALAQAAAKAQQNPEVGILVTGSFYTVSLAKKVWCSSVWQETLV